MPLAQSGHNRKKALVIISDGNDTSSRTDVSSLKRMIRETEVLVYAIGIDSQTEFGRAARGLGRRQRFRQPPRPDSRCRSRCPAAAAAALRRRRPPPTVSRRTSRGGNDAAGMDDRVNVAALREITDDSGGRTEIVRSTRDLDPGDGGHRRRAEPQYYLGYAATGVKDGQWHAIRVEVKQPELSRARAARLRRTEVIAVRSRQLTAHRRSSQTRDRS